MINSTMYFIIPLCLIGMHYIVKLEFNDSKIVKIWNYSMVTIYLTTIILS